MESYSPDIKEREDICEKILKRVERYLSPSISDSDIIRSFFLLQTVHILCAGYRMGCSEMGALYERDKMEDKINETLKSVGNLRRDCRRWASKNIKKKLDRMNSEFDIRKLSYHDSEY